MRKGTWTSTFLGAASLVILLLPSAAAGASAGVVSGGAASAATVVLTVAKSGGQFSTVQAAVNAVPDNSPTPYVILISPGIYSEIVTVPATKLHLTMEGSTGNPHDVVITGDRFHDESNGSGGTFGTEGSAIVHVKASNFTAEFITFQNTFNKNNHPGVTGTQAVAIAMEGDRQVYRDDIFFGHQDTLLTWDSTPALTLRQYVVDSEIDGDVDYIFGDGTLVVDHSMINAINDGVYTEAFLTAPATYATNPFGILINNSTVSTTLANGQVFLGRAWNAHSGTASQIVIRNTQLPAAVNASPWLGISGATWVAGNNEEYRNTGPGAAPSTDTARPQLADAQAPGFTAQKYLAGTDGWNPVVATQAWPSRGDQRTVTRPRIPAVCAAVTSALPGGGRTFSAEDEAAPPDTARIQAALDSCTDTGQAVLLAAAGPDTSFLSAPLTVHSGEFLVLDPAVTLYATLDAAAYQVPGGATCGSIGPSGTGCAPFISVSGRNAGIASALRGGREGTIDGRGDLDILGTSTSWWDQAATAKAEGLSQVNPRLIEADKSDNFTVADITLTHPAKQHLFFRDGIGLTVWRLRDDTPPGSPNTDGVNIESSSEVTVTHSYIKNGDDCVALTANDTAVSNVTVSHNHCYGSHGLSIGSGTTFGLDNISFNRNTLVGPHAFGVEADFNDGIRIKSYLGHGGQVTNVTYAHTCMMAVQNLIDIRPNYLPPVGTSIPDYRSVTVRGATAIRSAPGATSLLEGFDATHPLGLTMSNVHFDATSVSAQYANITMSGSDLSPSGTGVTVTPGTGSGRPLLCTFPPFPGR
jgi:pectin methylesterase-like acyl-CoA thioesterase/polygalacturonase